MGAGALIEIRSFFIRNGAAFLFLFVFFSPPFDFNFEYGEPFEYSPLANGNLSESPRL